MKSAIFSSGISVSEAVLRRRSSRHFLSRAVDPELLRKLIQLAARAPSGGNLQPWRITVLGGLELDAFKGRIARRLNEDDRADPPAYDIYPEKLGEPYRTSRYRNGEMLYSAIGVAREQKADRLQWFRRNFDCFGAPVLLFCHVERYMGQAQWSDLGMYLQTLMLLLVEHGLDSCAQECWALYHGTVNDYLQIAPGMLLFCGMSIGYTEPNAAINQWHSERIPLEEFAQFRGI